MYCILVVDNNKDSVEEVKQILGRKYHIKVVESGEKAIEYIGRERPDLILLDWFAAGMDGRETLQHICKESGESQIPVIILTADANKDIEVECLQLGASDVIAKPFVPEVMISRIDKTIQLDVLQNRLEQKLLVKSKQMERVTLRSVATLSNLIDAREEYTRNHSTNVSKYAIALAKKLNWTEGQMQNLHYVALLHDIGKVAIPDYILNKPGPLTEDEYRVVQSHTKVGAELLKDIKLVKDAVIGAQYHHERYDGTGYPDGLKGTDIPLIARILAVADAYVAMSSERIYRSRLTKEQITQELVKGKGTQFDPELTDIILQIHVNNELVGQDFAPMSDEMTSILDESNLLLQRVLEEQSMIESNMASTDPLTDILNRRYFESQVTRFLMDKNSKGSFFMIDLDNFKSVNDIYGHMVGDRVLKMVATMLRRSIRDSDMVCRMGGDEFAIFFRGLNTKSILRTKADRIMKLFSELMLEEEALRLSTLSIGIAVSGVDGTDYQTLYEKADKSLYYVKLNGKNAFHFYSGEADKMEPREVVQLSADLRNLMSVLQERENQRGVLKVGYNDFQRIYNFVSRCVQRSKRQVYILLITVRNVYGVYEDVDALERSVELLEKTINGCLRRADVSTRYSSSQFIVIIANSDKKGADKVIKRIEKHYISNNVDKEYVLAYEKAQIK